jgi:hypothetical protein
MTKRKHTWPLIVFAASVAAVVAFVISTSRLEQFGRVVASKDLTIDSGSRRVVMIERCTSGFEYLLQDRLFPYRMAEYEYWAELRDGARVIARTDSIWRDSTTFDHISIDAADAVGATVTLNSSYSPWVYRFEWLPDGIVAQRHAVPYGWATWARPNPNERSDQHHFH